MRFFVFLRIVITILVLSAATLGYINIVFTILPEAGQWTLVGMAPRDLVSLCNAMYAFICRFMSLLYNLLVRIRALLRISFPFEIPLFWLCRHWSLLSSQ